MKSIKTKKGKYVNFDNNLNNAINETIINSIDIDLEKREISISVEFACFINEQTMVSLKNCILS